MPTKISWCDETWNPIRGCTRVSEGCRHCYAERHAARFSGPGQPYEGLAMMTAAGPRWTGEIAFVEKVANQPLRWKRPRRIFVNSMSDLGHEGVKDAWWQDIFLTMELASHHQFQVLTKRPAILKERIERFTWHGDGPPKNIWWGVSAEDQATADARIPLLLQTPAAVRFVSAEPLLGPINLQMLAGYRDIPVLTNALTGRVGYGIGPADIPRLPRLDWVIVGAESGPGARPMDLKWARWIRDQCRTAGVAFFLKQVLVEGKKIETPELDGETWTQYPVGLEEAA